MNALFLVSYKRIVGVQFRDLAVVVGVGSIRFFFLAVAFS